MGLNYDPDMIPAQLLYKSRFFVTGVSLLILGTGNYLAASSKVVQYQAVVNELTPQISQTQPFFLRKEGTLFPSETWERWEIARTKLDYYHVVLSGGRLMISAGLACLVFALLKFRRDRSQLALP
jgi:hypothetical protein